MRISKTKIFLVLIVLTVEIRADQINYSLKEDKDTGSFVLQFNDKTKAKPIKKAKKARKAKEIKREARKMFGGMGSGLLAGGVGAAAGAMAMKNKQQNEFKENIRNLRAEHRLLEMKNDVEKDNMHLLFSAKVALAKVYSKVRSIDQDFQFIFQKKKDLLQEIMPEISV